MQTLRSSGCPTCSYHIFCLLFFVACLHWAEFYHYTVIVRKSFLKNHLILILNIEAFIFVTHFGPTFYFCFQNYVAFSQISSIGVHRCSLHASDFSQGLWRQIWTVCDTTSVSKDSELLLCKLSTQERYKKRRWDWNKPNVKMMRIHELFAIDSFGLKSKTCF